MKQKKIKINQSTLFIYKSGKLLHQNFPTGNTDTTTSMTSTAGTTGFNK